MKFLLTSNGLSNETIANSFRELINKEPEDSVVAFIPSAANAERGEKDWLIQDMYRIYSYGYKVEVVELAALEPNEIKEILTKSDALFVGGGNTFYLSFLMQKKGLFDLLPTLLKDKVYAGISAGSIIAGTTLLTDGAALANTKQFVDKDYKLVGPPGKSSGKALGLVNLAFRPHLHSAHFPGVTPALLREKAKLIKEPLYAVDDASALKIVDGNVEVVSEGFVETFN